MASSLNLIPYPKIVLMQMLLFFGHLYIIKRYLILPYLRQKEERENNTLHLKEANLVLSKKCHEMEECIDSMLFSMKKEIKQSQLLIQKEALNQKEIIFKDTYAAVEKIMRKEREKMMQIFREEELKIDQEVQILTKSICQHLIS